MFYMMIFSSGNVIEDPWNQLYNLPLIPLSPNEFILLDKWDLFYHFLLLQVALQGIEFWSNVCDEEVDLQIEAGEAAEMGRPPEHVSRFYAKGALQVISSWKGYKVRLS